MAITVVTTIITNMKTQIAAATGFTELSLVVDPENNAKRMTKSRYGIIPGAANETDSNIGHYTVDHDFTVQLTDDYIKLKADDSNKRTVTNSLMDKAHDVYQKIVKTKAGTPASVMNVKNLAVSEPIYFENEDTVLVNVGFTLTYRISI